MGSVPFPPLLLKHGLAGRYGLFARMTTSRDEVVLRELHRLPKELARSAEEAGLARKIGGEHWVDAR